MAPPEILLLSDDLIFTSRIAGEARVHGVSVKVAKTAAELLALARGPLVTLVIVDLANPGLNLADLMGELKAVGDPPPRVVAYGSHVDVAALKAARAAGCDPVLPRSKFVEELPKELMTWMGFESKPPG